MGAQKVVQLPCPPTSIS